MIAASYHCHRPLMEHPMRSVRNFLALVIPVTSVLLLSSCSTLVVVSSEYERKDATSYPEPEIVATSSYRNLIRSIKTIAVKAPELCVDETAAQSNGRSSSEGTILKTSCGVEMALIERELAKVGYNIVSWSFLKSTVNSTGQTTIDAANSLGADVLLSVNSLERSETLAGTQAQWSRQYFRSNTAGKKISPIKVNATQSEFLDKLAKEDEAFIVSPDLQRLSATVNAAVTSVQSGQTIWFYEWTLAEEQSDDFSNEILARCKSKVCVREARKSSRRPTAQNEVKVAGSSSGPIDQSARAADVDNARYNELLKRLVSDMVSRFKTS